MTNQWDVVHALVINDVKTKNETGYPTELG